MRTLSQKDAADFAHDHGRGVEQILEEIEGQDPEQERLNDQQQELAGLLLELIRKLIIPGSAAQSAQRFIVLALHLCPDVLNVSMLKAAAQMKLTRASLSRHSIRLSREWDLGHARWRKTRGAMTKYAAAQHRAVARGTHTAFHRKDRLRKSLAVDTPPGE